MFNGTGWVGWVICCCCFLGGGRGLVRLIAAFGSRILVVKGDLKGPWGLQCKIFSSPI